jgi:hypothetical protein
MSKKPRLRDEAVPDLDLNAWADALVTTAPDAVAEMRAVAKRLAGNTRLSAVDRDFAKSQLAAIDRAVRRNRQLARKRKTHH